tara:strand:+ start:147 stop:401 length:255 start_codon:yes stop_codon:yes gene_type:complete
MLDTLKQLLRVVLNVSDNSMLRGRTKYNQLDRAIDAVIKFCSEADWTDDDEKTEATAMIQRFQDAMGSGAWKLKKASDRVHANL